MVTIDDTQILVRRDTLANFVSKGVVPLNGEPIGLIGSDGKTTAYLIGDGVSTVDELPALSKGDPGPKGDPGLPGTNGVATDDATASNLSTTGTKTQAAGDSRYQLRSSITDWSAAFVAPAMNDVPAASVSTAQTITGDLIREKRVGDVAGAAGDLVNDTHFKFDGMLAMPPLGAVPNSFTTTDYLPGGNGQAARYTMAVDTVTDAVTSSIEFKLFSPTTTLTYRLVVNGRWVSTQAVRTTLAATGNTWLRLDFPTAGVRQVRLETAGGLGFGGVVVPTGATLARPRRPSRVKVAVLSDSYGGGAGTPPDGAGRLETWVNYIAKLLNADQFINFSVGGTGYVTDGSSTSRFINRAAAIVQFAPDILIVAGSRNDGSQDASTLRRAVQNTLDQFAALPNVYAIGPDSASGAATANDATRAGSLLAGRDFLDAIAAAWIGSGDLRSDGVHPTLAGHQKLAQNAWPAIQTMIRRNYGTVGVGTPSPPDGGTVAPTVLFSDNFDRADADTIGTGWSLIGGGTAGVRSNTAGPLSGSASQYVYFNPSASDGVFTGKIAAAGTSKNAMVLCRFSPNGGATFLALVATPSGYNLSKRLNSSTSVLQSSAVVPADGDTFEIRLSGSSVVVLVNGVQILTGTDTDLVANTLAGFFGGPGRLDNRFDDIKYVASS